MLKFYLAGRYDDRGLLADIRDALVGQGHCVTARWLNGSHEMRAGAASAAEARRFAEEDLRDLDAAHIFVLFNNPAVLDSVHGGRHTEYGYALAHGKILVIVGPRLSVFHHLQRVYQLDSFEAFLKSTATWMTEWTARQALTGAEAVEAPLMLRAAFNRRVGPTERNKLIAGIHAQAYKLRLDDETRREMQQKLVGVKSAKDMDLAQLSTVWRRLTTLVKDAGLSTQHSALSTRRKRPGRDERQPAEPPTAEQLEKIGHLYDALGVRPSADMMALCRRITGHPWPQNREEANKLIEGLKAMKARGWRARAVETGAVVAGAGSVLAEAAPADGRSLDARSVSQPPAAPVGEMEEEK